MPITYPRTFPASLMIESYSMRLRSAVSRTESPYTYQEQVYGYSGEIWELDVVIAALNRESADAYNSFLFSLRGKFGTFLLGDPAASTPRGAWGGTPLVMGAGQTGNDLNIDGLPLSTTNVARAGDSIQLGSGATARFHKVLEDANSNGSGQASLLISPRLRSSPADNAPITFTNAVCRWRLAENTVGFDVDSDVTYRTQFKAIEAL